MSNRISIDDLSDAIKNELENYNQVVTEKIKIKSKDAMNEFVKLTKKDAPKSNTKRRGTFMRNITSQKTYSGIGGDIYTWYVKDPEYRLTHLLKNGHHTRNGDRNTKAQDFITNNYYSVEEKYLEEVEEVIKNGS